MYCKHSCLLQNMFSLFPDFPFFAQFAVTLSFFVLRSDVLSLKCSTEIKFNWRVLSYHPARWGDLALEKESFRNMLFCNGRILSFSMYNCCVSFALFPDWPAFQSSRAWSRSAFWNGLWCSLPYSLHSYDTSDYLQSNKLKWNLSERC